MPVTISRVKLMPFLILAFLTFLNLTGHLTQATAAQIIRAEDHLIIRPRRVVLRRPLEIAKQFPERKTAVVTYPIISGLSNPAILRKVQAVLEVKNIFDYSLKDYREDAWLTEFGYIVNYNNNYLLDITFKQSGMAAYPDEQEKHLLINLRDGSLVKAVDVFDADKINQLVALADRALQQDIKRKLNENRDPADRETMREAYDNLKFEAKNVDDFSISARGVTFLYDAGFPHVIKAWEPRGRYFFSYATLNRMIKRDGLLARFKD